MTLQPDFITQNCQPVHDFLKGDKMFKFGYWILSSVENFANKIDTKVGIDINDITWRTQKDV